VIFVFPILRRSLEMKKKKKMAAAKGAVMHDHFNVKCENVYFLNAPYLLRFQFFIRRLLLLFDQLAWSFAITALY